MDTDDLDYCTECGCYYNVGIVCIEESKWTYDNTKYGKCPVCKEEVSYER